MDQYNQILNNFLSSDNSIRNNAENNLQILIKNEGI